jgi:hypothetical protein
MLKRAGRTHDPLGVDSTQAGQCAVECPACPHPNRNLPEGWEQASPVQRFEIFVWPLVEWLIQFQVDLCSRSHT